MVKNPYKNKVVPVTSIESGNGWRVTHNVHCYTNKIVNIVIVGDAESWVLIDAGMPRSAQKITREVDGLFGRDNKPDAIILTHGHFDHVGSAADLIEKWDVPVYAHPLEIPYITNQTNYQKPDSTATEGLITKLSNYFPNEPIDLSGHVQELPKDGSVPHMPGWRWIHTPGHTPGHVSLFRDTDKTLIAGDAFTTVRQDEMFEVVKQKKEINGPPPYFTPDWESAEASVKKLAALNPEYAVTGHGPPMYGRELEQGLGKLAHNFKDLAVPKNVKDK